MKAWKDIHPDYKGVIDGVKYVMVLDTDGATKSMPYKEARKLKLIK